MIFYDFVHKDQHNPLSKLKDHLDIIIIFD
jgi:hypothetical protein